MNHTYIQVNFRCSLQYFSIIILKSCNNIGLGLTYISATYDLIYANIRLEIGGLAYPAITTTQTLCGFYVGNVRLKPDTFGDRG